MDLRITLATLLTLIIVLPLLLVLLAVVVVLLLLVPTPDLVSQLNSIEEEI
jgi:hypothetical protein